MCLVFDSLKLTYRKKKHCFVLRIGGTNDEKRRDKNH